MSADEERSPTVLLISQWMADKFELQRGGIHQNNAAMEGLRGLAVSLVFLVHYGSSAALFHNVDAHTAHVTGIFLKVGEVGVDLFFVLSGYLIYGALISKPFTFAKFIKRRIVRIYPAFLVVFAAYLVLSYVFPDKSKIPVGLVPAAIYILQNVLLLPGIFRIDPMITVAWSLSYEMFFYIVMPLMILAARMQTWSSIARVLFLLTLVSIAFPMLMQAQGPVRLLMFGSGAILHESLRISGKVRLLSPLGFIALGAGLLAPLVSISGVAGTTFRSGVIFFAFFALCYCCFAASADERIVRFFSYTPLRWLGNMSYSYYLVHGLVLNGAFMVTGRIVDGAQVTLPIFLLAMPLYFAGTIVASAIPYVFVELKYSLRR